MIKSLTINGYRGFEQFEMRGLGRINLLVGTNNSGKTSLLEAIDLLARGGDPSSVWGNMTRRGERVPDYRDQHDPGSEIDVCHLFHGHEIEHGAKLRIEAVSIGGPQWVACSIVEAEEGHLLFDDDEFADEATALQIETHSSTAKIALPLTRRGGLTYDSVYRRRFSRKRNGKKASVQFIGPESLTSDRIGAIWRSIALTPEENLAVRALRTIEPHIERIAFLGSSRGMRFERGDFAVKFEGSDRRIPIGSMGDGMWRLLALAVATVRAEGGALLVDEIDTGLHYTILENMWKMVAETARRLNVQVFATTHSSDCVNSLAALCRRDKEVESEISLQRVERDHGQSVPFSEREVSIAAEKGIEVR